MAGYTHSGLAAGHVPFPLFHGGIAVYQQSQSNHPTSVYQYQEYPIQFPPQPSVPTNQPPWSQDVPHFSQMYNPYQFPVTQPQQYMIPGYAIPHPFSMCYFSGEGVHEDPVAFLEEFHKHAIARNCLSNDLKYQLMDHHLKGEALDWFRKLDKKELEYDNGLQTSFVQKFLYQFLNEDRRNKMEEDFYTRIQAEGEPGESYIHAKIQLWRRLQLNQQEVTNPDISAIRIGLRPHNEFFLNLKKPKNIEELRETVRLADKCRANPSVIPSIVQPMTNVANPSHQEEPRVQIVHNTQRQERKSLEARMDSLMQQMESLVVMQQKVLETVADRPRSSSRASGGGFKPVCFNCHKQGHYMDQCRSECGGCGASGHVISHCSSSKGQSSNVYNPATQRNLVSEAIKRNGDTGPEKQDFLKGGH